MMTRRTVVKMSASALIAIANRRLLAGAAPDRLFEYGSPLQEFGYGQVKFAPGLHQTQLEQTHAILMALSEDSLLRPFRLRSGLPAPGCDLGGWYSWNETAGGTFGQWLSALSRYHAISGDDESRAKVDRLVDGFAQTVNSLGQIFGDPAESPAYLYDKLTCGLMDAHEFAHSANALTILDAMTKAVIPRLPGRAMDQFETKDFGAHESYTLPENQFIAWQRGGDLSHLGLAKQYIHHSFFDPLANGEDVLAGRHAYSHVNSLCSAAKAYLVLGDARCLAAAKNGFAFLQTQSYVTGAWGPNETLCPVAAEAEYDRPAMASLAESLTKSHRSFETCCCAYAHFKLTRYLLRITRDSAYGDSMERVMYNTVLGAKALQSDGRAFYYSDYNMDGRKVYFDGIGLVPAQWPCDSGTLPQVAADYRVSAYFRDPAGIYVNLYIPSSVMWRQGGSQIVLSQSGTYPIEDHVAFEVRVARETEFALRLRIPRWVQRPSIRVNDRSVPGALEAGQFFELKRNWRSGDRIDLELPHGVVLTSIDSKNSDTVAISHGPLVLFAVPNQTSRPTRRQLLDAKRVAREGKEWQVDAANGPMRLLPFWEIGTEHYSTYLTLS